MHLPFVSAAQKFLDRVLTGICMVIKSNTSIQSNYNGALIDVTISNTKKERKKVLWIKTCEDTCWNQEDRLIVFDLTLRVLITTAEDNILLLFFFFYLLFFRRKIGFTFHLPSRWFTWNAKSYFIWIFFLTASAIILTSNLSVKKLCDETLIQHLPCYGQIQQMTN